MILAFVLQALCSLEDEMLVQTNRYRKEHSMEELLNLPSLQNAADLQVLHMCRSGRLSHEGPDKETAALTGRMRKFGFVGVNVGENIAKQGSSDYQEVARLWMHSAEHRNNILGDYVYSGVATCMGEDGNRYWVQVFGKDVSNARMARMRDGAPERGDGRDGTPWRLVHKSGSAVKTHDDCDSMSFGDYLLSHSPDEQPGVSRAYSPDGQNIKMQASTASIITFVLKNPNNSSILPAIQSIVDAIKQSEGQEPRPAAGLPDTQSQGPATRVMTTTVYRSPSSPADSGSSAAHLPGRISSPGPRNPELAQQGQNQNAKGPKRPRGPGKAGRGGRTQPDLRAVLDDLMRSGSVHLHISSGKGYSGDRCSDGVDIGSPFSYRS